MPGCRAWISCPRPVRPSHLLEDLVRHGGPARRPRPGPPADHELVPVDAREQVALAQCRRDARRELLQQQVAHAMPQCRSRPECRVEENHAPRCLRRRARVSDACSRRSARTLLAPGEAVVRRHELQPLPAWMRGDVPARATGSRSRGPLSSLSAEWCHSTQMTSVLAVVAVQQRRVPLRPSTCRGSSRGRGSSSSYVAPPGERAAQSSRACSRDRLGLSRPAHSCAAPRRTRSRERRVVEVRREDGLARRSSSSTIFCSWMSLVLAK